MAPRNARRCEDSFVLQGLLHTHGARASQAREGIGEVFLLLGIAPVPWRSLPTSHLRSFARRWRSCPRIAPGSKRRCWEAISVPFMTLSVPKTGLTYHKWSALPAMGFRCGKHWAQFLAFAQLLFCKLHVSARMTSRRHVQRLGFAVCAVRDRARSGMASHAMHLQK